MTTTVHGKPVAPVLGALLLAALSFALAQTMIAPALPSIAEEYGATPTAVSWLMTGFLLSASVATPLAGKLGDLFGKARVLTIVLSIFAVGNVVCAFADSIELLIAGRVIQGVAGGVFPLAFGIINDEIPGEKRAIAIGLVSATFGIGGGIGLPLAGFIVDNADISILFWIGLIAVPAAIAVSMMVPASPARERTSVDWLGAVVLSSGLAALLFGITKANAWGWTSGQTLGLLAGGVVVLALFVVLQLRTAQPLVDMRVMRERAVLATNVAGFLMGLSMFGAFLLVPQFVQTPEISGYGFGLSVTAAGLIMLPSSATMLFAGPIGGHLGSRFGFRIVMAIGTLLCAGSFLVLVGAHSAQWHFVVSGILLGAGISFAFASMANVIVSSVHPSQVGIATGINTVTRTVGGAFGSALVAALLTAETIPGTPFATEAAYTEAFAFSTVGACLALAAALAIPRLPRRRPEPVDPVTPTAEPAVVTAGV
jgi:EmrB/QacA subfamily drug resistance transporter